MSTQDPTDKPDKQLEQDSHENFESNEIPLPRKRKRKRPVREVPQAAAMRTCPIPMDIRSGVVNELPPNLRNHLKELEEWAAGNQRDAFYDAVAFWCLKIPAMIGSVTAGVWAHFQLTTISVIVGAISGLCILIDGVYPRGKLRNAHSRAAHDIRILINRMMLAWRTRNRSESVDDAASKIMLDAKRDIRRISKFVRDAETALEKQQKETGR